MPSASITIFNNIKFNLKIFYKLDIKTLIIENCLLINILNLMLIYNIALNFTKYLSLIEKKSFIH
jgi:hypothetical protein